MEIRKSDVPVIDMFNADEEYKAIGKAVRQEGHGRNIVNLNNYVVGVGVARRVKAGDKQSDIAKKYGISAATLSKSASVADLALAVAAAQSGESDRPLGEGYDNLTTYWMLWWKANQGEHGTFTDTMVDLVGDDGDARAEALVTMLRVFGAPSSAYGIIKGSKLHPDDPRNVKDDDQDDQDDQGDQGDQDDDKSSWQERLTALIGQCKLEGAETAEILAVVKSAL